MRHEPQLAARSRELCLRGARDAAANAARRCSSAADLAAKVPAPKPEDVKSLDAIMHADLRRDLRPGRRSRLEPLPFPVSSPGSLHPGGQGPRWSRRSSISWSVDEFIRDAGAVFAKEAFYENAIVNQPESYGNMTQVLSSYESRHSSRREAFRARRQFVPVAERRQALVGRLDLLGLRNVPTIRCRRSLAKK